MAVVGGTLLVTNFEGDSIAFVDTIDNEVIGTLTDPLFQQAGDEASPVDRSRIQPQSQRKVCGVQLNLIRPSLAISGLSRVSTGPISPHQRSCGPRTSAPSSGIPKCSRTSWSGLSIKVSRSTESSR